MIEIIGSTNNITRTGSQRISKIAPTKATLFTFITCPSHQYPDTMMLNKKTILLVLEFLNSVEYSFMKLKLIVLFYSNC
jgi:fumarylacetoacetate (FAA) hydrolase family protein